MLEHNLGMASMV